VTGMQDAAVAGGGVYHDAKRSPGDGVGD